MATLPVARIMGDEGEMLAVDLQSVMLAIIERRAAASLLDRQPRWSRFAAQRDLRQVEAGDGLPAPAAGQQPT